MLVHHFLETSAIQYPDKTALVCEGERYTYDRVNKAADEFAASIASMGIPAGERALVYLENTFEAVVAIFGILKSGLAFIPVNPGVKHKKLRYILTDSGACLMVCSVKNRQVVEEAFHGESGLRCVVWCDGDVPSFCRNWPLPAYTWEAFSKKPGGGRNKRNETIDCDLAAVLYTSGSTGDPKGVMCSHKNMVFASAGIVEFLENRSDDVVLNALPISFDYGLYQMLMMFRVGGTLVLEKYFGFPYRILELIEKENVSGFPIVPSMASLLFHLKDFSRFGFDRLRYITNTAAYLSHSRIQRLRKIFPDTLIYSMYGLTECKRVSWLPPEMINDKQGSVGIPLPGTRVHLIDENDCPVEMGSGITGELVVQGSHVMQGYWNDDQMTRSVFRKGRHRDGVHLYTGDLFQQDRDGFLYFIGRKNDLIKVRGERVSPREVEEAILELDSVSQAAVKGVDDEIDGQAVKAFVVPVPVTHLNKTDVLKHCRKNLEPFMVPKYIEILEQFAITPNGKIDKKHLV